MKRLLLMLSLSVVLLGCQQDIPLPGDDDFIGPLSEQQLEELNK